MNGSFMNDIRRMAEEVSARQGCYLYDIEFVGGGQGRTLRVFIDKEVEAGKEAGVSIEDCSNVSRGLNELLDAVENEIPGGAYSLEVSSPGLERVLKEPKHYQAAIGKKISAKTFAPLLDFNASVPALGKAKTVEGKLLSFDDKGLKVEFHAPKVEPAEVFVPFDQITKAHVVYEFADPSEMKGAAKGGPKNGKGKK